MKQRILFSIFLLFAFIGTCYSETPSFTAVVQPEVVVAGEHFRLRYVLNTTGGKNLRLPELEDFDILAGPFTSKSSSTTIVNGSISSTTEISYTYTLRCTVTGDYTIPPATIQIGGEVYKSNSVNVKVIPTDDPNALANVSQVQSSQNRSSQGGQTVQVASNGKNEPTFVRQIFSKSSCYEQEAILVTYKLYTREDVRGVSPRFPEFKDFYVQEIENEHSPTVEHYNGLNYTTIILKQYLLFPQRSGVIDIDKFNIDVTLLVRTNIDNPFGAFFSSAQEVKKSITVQQSKINVKSLPKPAPKGFNGAVGNYTLKSSISSTEVNANDAVTVKLSISGKGNLKLLKNPEIKFPTDFDVYDPKQTNKIKTTIGGLVGSRDIEYLSIPRFGGEFEIPSADFVYFDPLAETYKTLQTGKFTLKVNGQKDDNQVVVVGGGSKTISNKESVKNIGSDIKYIATNTRLVKQNDFIFGSTLFYLAYLVPLFLFVLVTLIMHKQAKENANIVLRKTKKANKQALKRLKLSATYYKKGEKESFYEETMKALWGYLSDKLSIPAADLNKDNAQDELLKRGVSDDLIKEFLQTLSDCEYARFAPVVDESLSMKHIYERSLDLIAKLDSNLKL